MKKKYLVIYCFYFLAGLEARAALLKPDTSVKCVAKEENSEIKTFSFDLYATGFPMAGIGMFSGMFEAEAPGWNCSLLRGHLYTGFSENHLQHTARSHCLDSYDFVLNVGTSFYKKGEVYAGALLFRKRGPFESVHYQTRSVSCELQ